jgi:hypothetical protein
MTKGQQIGLGLNALGLALFAIWFVLRNQLPNSLSIVLAIVFLAVLGASLFLLISATKSIKEPHEKPKR